MPCGLLMTQSGIITQGSVKAATKGNISGRAKSAPGQVLTQARLGMMAASRDVSPHRSPYHSPTLKEPALRVDTSSLPTSMRVPEAMTMQQRRTEP